MQLVGLRRVFSNTNDKTFPSSLNNLLYSHQQFLPEPTATSHASSPLHVLHQASSFIKKLIIMTLAKMIEHRREFIAYLSQDILSFIFSTTLLNIGGAYHSVQRNERGHPLPRAQVPGLAFCPQLMASRLSFSSSAIRSNGHVGYVSEYESYAKVYHGIIRDFRYTFATNNFQNTQSLKNLHMHTCWPLLANCYIPKSRWQIHNIYEYKYAA